MLSGLKQLVKKQNDKNSQLQNKLGIKPAENNGILLYSFFFAKMILVMWLIVLVIKTSEKIQYVSIYNIKIS